MSHDIRHYIRIVESAEIVEAMPPEAMQSTRYYHGTKTRAAATNILQYGLQPGAQKQGRGKLAPVVGKVYITPDLHYAVIYALGGVMMGHKMELDRCEGNRFGYVFVVDSSQLKDVQPDEDSVGEFVQNHTVQGWDQTKNPWRRLPLTFKPDGIEDDYKRNVWYNIKSGMTEKQFFDAVDGLIDAQASGGKRALKRLSDHDKIALIRWGAHVAHSGGIPVTECWKIDKLKSIEIAKDCSNFFDIAERIK